MDEPVFILDDRHELHEIYRSLCTTCVYFIQKNYNCKAFPEQVPDKYLTGDEKHLQVDPGQVGETVYEKYKRFE